MTRRQLINIKMKEKNYTNKTLSDKLGYTEMTLCNIKAGRSLADNNVVKTINELEITPKEFLECDEDEKRKKKVNNKQVDK